MAFPFDFDEAKPYVDYHVFELKGGEKCRIVGVCLDPQQGKFTLYAEDQEIEVRIQSDTDAPLSGVAVRAMGTMHKTKEGLYLEADIIQLISNIRLQQYYDLLSLEREAQGDPKEL